MHWLWVMIVGAAVGAFAGAIMSPSQSRGWIDHIIAGVLGALRTCLDTLTFDLILVKLDQKQEFLIHEKLCTPL
ncbi:hypothetical protein [Lactiplantibacillus plantarum]|uniref:hypothetical protein n=1 Tax=Lactiplantibacillus plantarum TaxID=1590 RepID=UPI001EE1D541|nr:hypothetical protein [Lactiplantibacillus plantarum]